jgi:hypothetical protein
MMNASLALAATAAAVAIGFGSAYADAPVGKLPITFAYTKEFSACRANPAGLAFEVRAGKISLLDQLGNRVETVPISPTGAFSMHIENSSHYKFVDYWGVYKDGTVSGGFHIVGYGFDCGAAVTAATTK